VVFHGVFDSPPVALWAPSFLSSLSPLRSGGWLQVYSQGTPPRAVLPTFRLCPATVNSRQCLTADMPPLFLKTARPLRVGSHNA